MENWRQASTPKKKTSFSTKATVIGEIMISFHGRLKKMADKKPVKTEAETLKPETKLSFTAFFLNNKLFPILNEDHDTCYGLESGKTISRLSSRSQPTH